MWINSAQHKNGATLTLACDECGTVFLPASYPNARSGQGNRRGWDDKASYWHWANISGWARVGRAPDRHVCASC